MSYQKGSAQSSGLPIVKVPRMTQALNSALPITTPKMNPTSAFTPTKLVRIEPKIAPSSKPPQFVTVSPSQLARLQQQQPQTSSLVGNFHNRFETTGTIQDGSSGKLANLKRQWNLTSSPKTQQISVSHQQPVSAVPYQPPSLHGAFSGIKIIPNSTSSIQAALTSTAGFQHSTGNSIQGTSTPFSSSSQQLISYSSLTGQTGALSGETSTPSHNPNSNSGGSLSKVVNSSQKTSSKFQYISASKQLMESLGANKRTCNCTKSLCLKLYCECFANGEFCFSCNCTNCFNTLENEFERNEAMRACLSRNPHAFHPKIGKASFSEERSHYKGCNCKRSNCLKNYCECYEAKITCTSLCKCTGCYNTEERNGMRCFGDVTALRLLKEGTLRDLSYYRNGFIDKVPFTLITEEVIEAIIQCLLAQAEEAFMAQRPLAETECMLLQEFGNCTTKIIENAASFKTSDTSSSPFEDY